jgi:hypothetical protein
MGTSGKTEIQSMSEAVRFMILEGFNRYRIYEDGRVFNTITGKFMCSEDDCKDGYRKMKLTNNIGNRITWWLSRLIYTAFHGPIPNGFEVDHIDGDRLNNSLDNLSIVTHKQNQILKKQRDSKTLFNRKPPHKRPPKRGKIS